MSAKVAEVLDIVDSSGLPYKLTPMGTIVEGEWNDLMRLVRQCHRKMMKNEERVLTRILIDDRKGKTGRMDRKIRSVEKRLGRSLKK
ncbi:MAG: putative cytosolic protein, partial [Nitrospirae bacterium]|nr:putative cytosolic protein [Nitrospirota bacterium]